MVAVYGSSIPAYEDALAMKASKQRVVEKVLEINRRQPDTSTAAGVAAQTGILTSLEGMTASKEAKLGPEVKKQLVEYLLKVLVACETPSPGPGLQSESEDGRQSLQRVALKTLVNVSRSDLEAFAQDSAVRLTLAEFNRRQWQHSRLQAAYMQRLLDQVRLSPQMAAIEGSLIDMFLALLVDGEDKAASPGRQAGDAGFQLHAAGVTETVNYLQMIVETAAENTSTFFSTERIVVSLIRKVAAKHDPSEAQIEGVARTLLVVLEKLAERSPQVVPYFIESYLREFTVRMADPGAGGSIFEQLHWRFFGVLVKHSKLTGRFA